MMETVKEKVELQKYPVYKDSGVEWLGKLPSHWEIEKGKWLFKKEDRPIHEEDEVVTCFRDGEVTLRANRRTEGFTNSLKEHGYQGIRKGDLVIHNMDAFAGAIGVSDSDGKSTPVYSACTPLHQNEVDPYYYAYFLRDLALNGFIESLAKGIRERSTDFRFNDFGKLLLAVPPFEEQTSIANFLDRKTEQIDQAIAIKQKQIELLKERRQILINKAVTCGLNPDAPLKPSGVDWIGEIPEHWEVRRFRNVFYLDKGLTITKENLIDEGVYCVNYGEIHSKYGFEVSPELHDLKCVDKYYLNSSPKSLLKKGDFIFADTSEDLEGSGNFTYLNSSKKTFAGYHTIIAKPKFSFVSRFLAYVIDSLSFRNQIKTRVKGVKVYSISQSILKETTVWLPPRNEQEAIVENLDQRCEKIDNSISLIQEQIKILRHYKTTLINSAVTGKIKVS